MADVGEELAVWGRGSVRVERGLCSPETRSRDGKALGVCIPSSEGMPTGSPQKVHDGCRLVTHVNAKLPK